MARTSLIHANRMWPDAISVALWPYALRHAKNGINSTPFPTSEKTPMELFSGTKNVLPNYKDVHPFGCPAYALDGKVQGGMKAKKWSTRARLAVYLGPSAQHARSVGLLLSITTGLVSPQFHVRYDDSFSTLRESRVPRSEWQTLSGLEKPKMVTKFPKQDTRIPVGENNEVILVDGIEAEPELNEEQLAEIQPENSEQDAEGIGVEIDADDDDMSVESDDEIEQTMHLSSQGRPVTRSGRTVNYPRRYDDYVALPASINADEQYWDPNVYSYSASSDLDVMHLNQAMKAPDRTNLSK